VRDQDWDLLLLRIKRGKCTPFLGAGACAGTLPLGGDVATRWADRYDYPLEDRRDLPRVAQFVGINQEDGMFPKDLLREEFDGLGPPDFDRRGEPHAVLAGLPLPIYMTTNYDDFMTAALIARGKEPVREFCHWNRNPAVVGEPDSLRNGTVPSERSPVVFHLHGHFGIPESIVLAEDDYLDFLVAISKDASVLPHEIQKALAGSTLLFIGYSLADWSFRVVHRGLVSAGEEALRRLSITVQLPPSEREQVYLDKYFHAMSVRVFWGTAEDFMAELSERWNASDGDA
jgi:hypothetical protein